MKDGKNCVLYEGRPCIECGECDVCDLDASKTCDNCMKCIKDESDFRAIRIDGILTPEETLDGEEEGTKGE